MSRRHRYRPSLEQIARHEAGHAVAAIACGAVVAFAFVTPAGGRVDTAHLSPHEDPLVAGIVAWGGPVAEGVDFIGVDDAAAFERGHLSPRSIATLRHWAVKLIKAYGPAVDAIGAALVARGNLTGLQIKRLAFRACPDLRAEAAPIPREVTAHVLRERPALASSIGKLERLHVQARRRR